MTIARSYVPSPYLQDKVNGPCFGTGDGLFARNPGEEVGLFHDPRIVFGITKKLDPSTSPNGAKAGVIGEEFPAAAIDSASASFFEDAGEVPDDDRIAFGTFHRWWLCRQHVPRHESSKPEGTLVGAPVGGFLDQVLSLHHVGVGAVFNVLARPKSVKERFVGSTAASAAPLLLVLRGPLGVPDVVGNDGPQRVSFFGFAISKQTLVNRLSPGEIRRLAVPQTTIGRVRSDMRPHLLRETVLDPFEILGSVKNVGHIHTEGSVLDVIGVTSPPNCRVARLDVELDEVQDGRSHG